MIVGQCYAEAIYIPDGEYHGTWGGYAVRFVANGFNIVAKWKVGIRTPNAHATITIRDRKVVAVCETSVRGRDAGAALLPQRFQWRDSGSEAWQFGACFPVVYGESDCWFVHCGRHGTGSFDSDPWEILGHLIGGEVLEFRWIDNDHGWHG